MADYGLEYIFPEVVVHMPFPDGSYLTQWHDLERTGREFAKFSKQDAATYRRMMDEFAAIKPVFDAASYTPVGFGKPLAERLGEHPDGKKWQRRIAMSAWEIIRDNFDGRSLPRLHAVDGDADRGAAGAADVGPARLCRSATAASAGAGACRRAARAH